jgi:hypothetical protein
MIVTWFRKLLRNSDVSARRVIAQPLGLLITRNALDALMAALSKSMEMQHEGVAYLLGRTDGTSTIGIAVFAPDAHTTPGSFHVSSRAMADCVRLAADLNLQIVGQVHTHPGAAGHTDGDEEGAKIRYAGYTSIVIPDYGCRLPSLDGIAAYIWQTPNGWVRLDHDAITIIPGAGPWTKSSLPQR